VKIRHSNQHDIKAIAALHRLAFGSEEGDSVADLAVDLIADESSLPVMSLVAQEQDHLIGHILFTAVAVDGFEALKGQMLSPLAVAPKMQKQGIGSKLVSKALEELKAQGIDYAVVYGSPDYYGRFGFSVDHSIQAPYPLKFPFGWQALAFSSVGLDELNGLLKCAKPFQNPDHW